MKLRVVNFLILCCFISYATPVQASLLLSQSIGSTNSGAIIPTVIQTFELQNTKISAISVDFTPLSGDTFCHTLSVFVDSTEYPADSEQCYSGVFNSVVPVTYNFSTSVEVPNGSSAYFAISWSSMQRGWLKASNVDVYSGGECFEGSVGGGACDNGIQDLRFTISGEPLFQLLGSSTPAMIFESVKDGVQQTGENNWPLLMLLGIPTGFSVAGATVLLIRRMV